MHAVVVHTIQGETCDMSWLKKLFGREDDRRGPDAPVPLASPTGPGPDDPEPEAPEVDEAELQRMIEEAFAARGAFYARLGDVHPDVIAPMINPSFMGGPRWPAMRQAWRVVRRPGSTIVASDGLSDPFDDDLTPLGFRVEVCAESAESFSDTGEVIRSWLCSLVRQVSQLAAQGRLYDALERYGILSTIVQGDGAPEKALNEQGMVGVIIGFPTPEIPPEIELPEGKVRLLVLKTLFPSELAYLESHEDMAAARQTLVARLLEQPGAHLCGFDREPVA